MVVIETGLNKDFSNTIVEVKIQWYVQVNWERGRVVGRGLSVNLMF